MKINYLKEDKKRENMFKILNLRFRSFLAWDMVRKEFFDERLAYMLPIGQKSYDSVLKMEVMFK